MAYFIKRPATPRHKIATTCPINQPFPSAKVTNDPSMHRLHRECSLIHAPGKVHAYVKPRRTTGRRSVRACVMAINQRASSFDGIEIHSCRSVTLPLEGSPRGGGGQRRAETNPLQGAPRKPLRFHGNSTAHRFARLTLLSPYGCPLCNGKLHYACAHACCADVVMFFMSFLCLKNSARMRSDKSKKKQQSGRTQTMRDACKRMPTNAAWFV